MNPNPKIIPFLHSHYTYSYLKENIYNFYPGVIYNLRYSILHCCRVGIHFASLPNAVSYIEKFDINEIPEDDWEGLSYNDNALHLLNKNPEKINWENLCKATSCANDLITKNLDKLSDQDWYQLSYNLNYEDIVINNRFDELNWEVLAEYYNTKRSDLIKQNSDKFTTRNNDYFWMYIFRNPHLLDMIKQNIYNLPYTCMMRDLFKNPGIFKLNYPAMREKCMPFAEELAAHVFHPDRISRISESYGIEFYDYMEIV